MRQAKDRFGLNRDQLGAYASVAGKLKDWRPATEVLTKVQAVPTIMPQYDVATRVMGHPISRFVRLHGPSSEGKTTFSIGLMLSFLRAGHFAGFADAERTTPPEWLAELMGEYLHHPAFNALPVTSYEHTVDAVRAYCETIAESRAKGEIPEETTGLIVIDSIRKLMPKKLLSELLKKGTKDKGVDGFGGRAAQVKAALNAAWVDELVPLLADTRMAMVVIARETEDPDADLWSPVDYKVGGGKALYYDSSLDLRVLRSYLTDKEDRKIIYGERHRIEVHKTKVGRKEQRIPVANFHTINGIEPGTVPGFDRARDVLELAVEHEVVRLSGSSYTYDGKRLGQGELKALAGLRADSDLLSAIELAARNKAAEGWL